MIRTVRALMLAAGLLAAAAAPALANDLPPAALAKGEALPARVVETADGKPVNLAEFDGVTVLHLFACDSAVCGESLPAFEKELWQPLRESGRVRVIGIGRDAGAGELTAMAAERGITFPLVPDPDRSLARMFADGGRGVPRTVITGPDGTVRHLHPGYRAGRATEARLIAEAILDGRPLPEEEEAERMRAAREAMENMKMAKEFLGGPAPEVFVEKWITADPGDTAGKWVLVEFWATWCGPCIATMPHLEELSKSHRDVLVIKSISDEDEETVRPFVEEKGFTYPIGIDTRRRTIEAAEVRGIPHGILVDPQGIVRWEGHPMALAQPGELDAILKRGAGGE
jgi:peroxiredoxin